MINEFCLQIIQWEGGSRVGEFMDDIRYDHKLLILKLRGLSYYFYM